MSDRQRALPTSTCTEPRSGNHSQATLVSDPENRIDAAPTLALYQALIKAQ